MRSQDEIVAYIRANDDLFGFAREVLIPRLDFEHAKEWLREGVTPEEWQELLESEDVPPLDAMRKYMDFAIGKARDHRGLSASRSVMKLNAWTFLLGFEPIEDPFPNYGAPILKALCQRHEFNWPDDDVALNRMAEGLPCHDGCMEGC